MWPVKVEGETIRSDMKSELLDDSKRHFYAR